MTDLQTTQPAAVATPRQSFLAAACASANATPEQIKQTLKDIFFRPRRAGERPPSPEAQDAHLITVLALCDRHGLDPFAKEVYAWVDNNGTLNMVISPDGVFRLVAQQPRYGGHTFKHEYINERLHAVVCTIHWEGWKFPPTKRIIVSEWRTSNWNNKEHHYAELRAFKQCARQVMWLPMDEDERALAQPVETPHTVVSTSPARGTAALAAKLIDDRPAEPAPLPEVAAEPEPQADPAPTGEDVAAMARRLFNRCVDLKGATGDELFAYIIEEAGGKPGAAADSFAAIKPKHAPAAMELLNRAAVVLSDVG